MPPQKPLKARRTSTGVAHHTANSCCSAAAGLQAWLSLNAQMHQGVYVPEGTRHRSPRLSIAASTQSLARHCGRGKKELVLVLLLFRHPQRSRSDQLRFLIPS